MTAFFFSALIQKEEGDRVEKTDGFSCDETAGKGIFNDGSGTDIILTGDNKASVYGFRNSNGKNRKPESYTLEELCSETPSVYQYVFTLEHAWKYHYGSKGTALSDVQKDLDAQYAYYGLERPESYYGRLNEGIAREMTEGQAESQGPALTM